MNKKMSMFNKNIKMVIKLIIIIIIKVKLITQILGIIKSKMIIGRIQLKMKLNLNMININNKLK